MAGTRIIEQWWSDRGLEELARTIGEWYQALRFGPIPGAYLNFQLHEIQGDDVTGVNTGLQRVAVLPIPPAGEGTFEMRPIFFGVFVTAVSGSIVSGNIDIPNDPFGSKLLAADFNAGPGFPFSTNKREDFAVDKVVVPAGSTFASLGLNLTVVTNPLNTLAVDTHMIFKEISQVEP